MVSRDAYLWGCGSDFALLGVTVGVPGMVD